MALHLEFYFLIPQFHPSWNDHIMWILIPKFANYSKSNFKLSAFMILRLGVKLIELKPEQFRQWVHNSVLLAEWWTRRIQDPFSSEARVRSPQSTWHAYGIADTAKLNAINFEFKFAWFELKFVQRLIMSENSMCTSNSISSSIEAIRFGESNWISDATLKCFESVHL